MNLVPVIHRMRELDIFCMEDRLLTFFALCFVVIERTQSIFAGCQDHIEGKITIDEAQKRIYSYYEQRTNRIELEDNTKEADIVSARITKLLGEKAFQFSPAEWITIHRRLFEDVFDHAGNIRQYNISKKEWILNGETVQNGCGYRNKYRLLPAG